MASFEDVSSSFAVSSYKGARNFDNCSWSCGNESSIGGLPGPSRVTDFNFPAAASLSLAIVLRRSAFFCRNFFCRLALSIFIFRVDFALAVSNFLSLQTHCLLSSPGRIFSHGGQWFPSPFFPELVCCTMFFLIFQHRIPVALVYCQDRLVWQTWRCICIPCLFWRTHCGRRRLSFHHRCSWIKFYPPFLRMTERREYSFALMLGLQLYQTRLKCVHVVRTFPLFSPFRIYFLFTIFSTGHVKVGSLIRLRKPIIPLSVILSHFNAK